MTTEQKAQFELLKTFAEICRENGLQYFLIGGTLLGAVRHRGFIPWDDDIDVVMPEADYRHFLSLKDTLPPHLAVQCQDTDEWYPFLFGKLCDTRYPYDTAMPHGPLGLYIDIFPLSPLKKNSAFTRVKLNAIKVIDYILQIRTGWTKDIPYKNKIANLGFRLLNRLPSKSLKSLQMRMIKQLRGTPDSNLLVSFGGAYKADKETFPKEWFSHHLDFPFEASEFSSPCGWHAYLSRNYGDYMTLPPEEAQISRHK